jgi:membrane-bound transcription factor site-1 protease
LWPLDAPLYARGQPRAVNVTIYNSRATLSRIARPPEWEPALDTGGWALSLAFSHAERVDQHCGYVGIAVSVRPEAAAYTGEARGHVVLWLQDEGPGADAMAHSVRIALRAHIMPTPPRERRLLLDTHHSASYPQGFFPNDDLARLDREVMDWPADGPLAGHLELHRALFAAGYFVEQLTVPFHASGLDPANYGALLLLDPEEPIDSASAANLRAAVERSGLGLVVAADWWSSEQMRALDHADAAVDGAPIRICGSAGAHVPSLNRLLAPWGVRFGEGVWSGAYATGSTAPMIDHASGSAIVSFPRGGLLLRALVHRVRPTARGGEAARRGEPQHVGVLGVARVGAAGGWLAALADSSCTDDSSRRNCRHLLIDLVGHMLGQRLQRAAPLVAPEGHERLVRLVEPESSGATMGSLTNAQAAAFAADSRLLNPTTATVVPPWRGEVVSASVAGEPLVPSIAVCLGLCALCLLACTRAQRRRSILRKPKDC